MFIGYLVVIECDLLYMLSTGGAGPSYQHSGPTHLSGEIVLLRVSGDGLQDIIALTSVASAQLVLLGEA